MSELPEKQVKRLKALLSEAETNLAAARELLTSLVGEDPMLDQSQRDEAVGKVIEGVFDGQNMIGPDGKVYSIPVNYSSKSKLVEGDILKLTIDNLGNFIYKQIGPVERARLMGVLARDQDKGDYLVVSDDHMFKVLAASVSYYKGAEGDQVVVLVPKDADSKWGAVENIIKRGNSNSQQGNSN